MIWLVYILECSDGTYYTGISNNIKKRIAKHNSGKGAKYTRGRLPVKLLWKCECEDKSSSLKEEFRIKKLSRKQKEALIENLKTASED